MVNRIRRKSGKTKRTVLRNNPKSRKVSRVRKSTRKKRSKKSLKKKKTKKKRSRKRLVGGSSDEEWPTEAYSPPSEWRLIGNGVDGYVYKAKVLVSGKETGEEVCIKKQLIGTEKLRFIYEDEVDMLKSIQGIPGTVILRNYYEKIEGTVHRSGAAGGEPAPHGYIVMECVDGHNLSECREFEDQGRSVIRKILETLQQIQAKEIVHNDLTLKNIMVKNCKPDTEVTIIDFGRGGRTTDPEDFKIDIRKLGTSLKFLSPEFTKILRGFTKILPGFKNKQDKPCPTIQELLDHPWFTELEPGFTKKWVQFTEIEQKSAEELGFKQDTWDNAEEGYPLFDKEWQSLTVTEQEAATNLGMGEEDFRVPDDAAVVQKALAREEWPAEAYSPPSEWRLIGKGVYGYVYKAKVLGPGGELREEVCIKRLSIGTEGQRSLYEKEVTILKSIKGIPGTVTLRNYYEEVEGEDTYGYIVMECVVGHNLFECAGKFEYGEERPIFRKILETLEQIHEKGIVHNDLTWGNIMVKHCEPGTPGTPVTIIDFGQASMEKDFDKLRIREITNLILLVAEKMNGHARSAVIESFKLDRDPFPTIQELLDHPWFTELEPGYFKEWVQLTETERKAAGILDFTPKTWDDGWKHDGMIRKFLRENKWQSLTDTQQEAAANLGLEETDFTDAASRA